MSRAFHHIGDYRARSRQLSGTASVKHRIAQRIAAYRHGVEHIVDTGKGIFFFQKVRRNGYLIAILRLPADRQKLDCRIQLLCIGKICRIDSGDALRMDFVEINGLSRYEGGQNRNFAARIVAFHVCFRIALRIAQCLRLTKGFFKQHALLFHLC